MTSHAQTLQQGNMYRNLKCFLPLKASKETLKFSLPYYTYCSKRKRISITMSSADLDSDYSDSTMCFTYIWLSLMYTVEIKFSVLCVGLEFCLSASEPVFCVDNFLPIRNGERFLAFVLLGDFCWYHGLGFVFFLKGQDRGRQDRHVKNFPYKEA
uniref:Uncharacterized protein n=1 Tax=Glossina brevipalpis TaxID=37001 RepID=A0A1A9WV95_9MUSC